MLTLFSIFLFCVNSQPESKVTLTDYKNKDSPIYVIAPYYESYYIELFDQEDVLGNTSFQNINTTNNQNFNAISENFIETSNKTLDRSFCPVDEWAPLYQPVRFYLSTTTLDLLFYNKDDKNRVQVYQSLHKDLYILLDFLNPRSTTINCFSIFQLDLDNYFGLDCNLNSTQTFLKFALQYDTNNVISNFTLDSSASYKYSINEQEETIQECPFRKTINVKIFDEADQLQNQLIQYCPSQKSEKEITNKFFIVHRQSVDKDGIYRLHAFTADIENLNGCSIDKDTQIESIFSNLMVNGYELTTWNVGFLFSEAPLICKCNIKQSITFQYTIACTSTEIELYQPSQIRLVKTLNDEVVLVTGTNTAVLIIYLERSYLSQNYITLSYKQIYEPGFYLVDVTLTSQYLAVILTDSPFVYYSSPHFHKPNLYCSQQEVGDTKNIMKIFYIDTQYNTIYYQSNEVNQFQSFLNSLNQVDFGDFFLMYDFVNSRLNVITLFSKLMNVSYSLGYQDPKETFFISIPPVIITFEIQGGYQELNQQTLQVSYKEIKFTRHIVICFIKLEDDRFQLIANVFRYDPKDPPLTICPISRDVRIFQEIINSIDLFQGIMGPLLNFNYVPNYNMSRFYPYYLNHKSIISKDKYREKFENIKQSRNVYNVLSALNKNILKTSNIFGVIEILLTYESNNSNSKAIIINQTCIINAKDFQQMEKQFPIQIQIKQCSEYAKRNLSEFMNQVDYYKEFHFYDLAVQYQDSKIVVCEKETRFFHKLCQNITNMQTDDTIQQIDIQQGPVQVDKVSYFFTILYQSNPMQLQFFVLSIFLPNQFIPQIEQHNSTNYFTLMTENQIVSFRYTYINQQTLFILFQNAVLTIYTPGPSNNTKDQKYYNFTSNLTNYSKTIPECVDNEFIGFEITNNSQSRFSNQYLVVWCSASKNQLDQYQYEPFIFQFIIRSINQINFWRRLPYYDAILSNRTDFFISGLILYVPVLKRNVYNNYFQSYNIYNLEDYTPRSLVEEIVVEKRPNEKIITSPINNLLSSLLSGSSISLTLIISSKKFEIYYLNQKAEFIFHLQQNFIAAYNQSPLVLVIAVFQPTKTVTMFRNYTLVYNFSSTQITFAYNNENSYNLAIDQTYLKKQGGFYQYLLLVNQSFFNGPIASYSYSTNQDELTIIPSPYLQMNKYLGYYMETIDQYGQVNQIIDVGDEIYVGLFNQNIINNATYRDIILVLTDTHILFYQKSSVPDQNQSCSQTNYNQTFNQTSTNQSQCSIRLIYSQILKSIQGFSYCQMELNGINAIIVLCQMKILNEITLNATKQNKENIQLFIYLQYQYFQLNNTINILSNNESQKQFCFCYFSDMQPFLYNDRVYQMIKTGYQHVNTYFGIYYFDVENVKFVLINSYPDQNSTNPYQYAADYALSVIQYNNQTLLYLIMLQKQNILVQVIEMSEGFPALNNSYLQFNHDQQFVLYENAVFIQAINHFQPHNITPSITDQVFIVGNNNQVYEISFNVFTLEANLQYTFYQYLLCHHNFISRPQIELQYQNDSVFYLVTQCLSNQFEYQSLQVEMTYLLNQLNTNIVYTSLFIRNSSRNYSRPVEILEPYLVNPQELHLQKIQLYEVFSSTTGNQSSSHLLISNSTHFLIDLIVYSDNGYYLYYPASLAEQDQDQSVNLSIVAYNSYSQCNTTFTIEWFMEDSQINSRAWFYVLLSIICLALLILFVVLIVGQCQNKEGNNDADNENHLQKKDDDSSEYGVELQRAERNQQILFGDVLKDVFKKQTYYEIDDD